MKIGKLNIDNPIFLAPMAGITDHPYRVLCREMGAGVVFTEFVSANGIIRENMKTMELIRFSEKERPIGIQLFGELPDVVGKSAKLVYEMLKPDIIDINYGCPVPKVTKRGAGSAALKDLCLMDEITHSVVESVPEIPVTVKMRSGWDEEHIVSTEAGIRMEKIGVSAITLHPRTTKQQFSGKSNWNLIKELKNEVNIPIIGNGDVQTRDDYKKMKDQTRCDGVMIGRGALGNPWIFKSIFSNNKDEIKSNVDILEIIRISKRHFKMMEAYYSPHICINHTKKHFSWYFKGFDGAAKWRKIFMNIQHISEINIILNKMEDYFMPILK
jgi:tRNA-dihydrouridine synthase B